MCTARTDENNNVFIETEYGKEHLSLAHIYEKGCTNLIFEVNSNQQNGTHYKYNDCQFGKVEINDDLTPGVPIVLVEFIDCSIEKQLIVPYHTTILFERTNIKGDIIRKPCAVHL